jgi:hypothetical protein
LPNSVDPRPPLLPSAVLDLRGPPALVAVAAVVGAAAAGVVVVVAATAIIVIVATTTVARVAAPALATAAGPTAPLHRQPARARMAPPGRPTTPGLVPSTCGRAHPGHRSHPDRRTPSSLHRRWGHRSRLLLRLCLFLALRHLSSSPGHRGQGSGIHSPSPTPSAP